MFYQTIVCLIKFWANGQLWKSKKSGNNMFLTLFIGWFGIQIPSMHFILWHYGFCTCCILLISGLETRSGECFCSARPDQAERSILPLLWCNKMWLTIFVERYHNDLVFSFCIWFLVFGFCCRLISDAPRCDMSYLLAVQDAYFPIVSTCIYTRASTCI